MEFSARQIAELINGEVVGDPEVKVSGLSRIEEGKPKTLSFLANPAYTTHIYTTGASIVIVNRSFQPEKEIPSTCTLIKVEDAYSGFAKLLEMYNKLQHNKTGVESGSFVSESARLGENVFVAATVYISENAVIGDNVKIYPHCFIGSNVKIGDNTILHSGVKIYADCEIGSDCILHGGVVIGGDGFGFARGSSQYSKVAQIGNVIVEEGVEIGSNTTIDRATLGSTIIRKGVKLDNLIQVAHNVEIGENTVIAAQTGIAGSTHIGKNCMIGGQVGIVGHLTIADGTRIAAQSGIGASITEKDTVMQGSPAFSIGEYKRSYVGFRNLPQLMQRLSDLEKKIGEKNNQTL